MPELFHSFQNEDSSSARSSTDTPLQNKDALIPMTARIAVYDTLLAAPRIVEIAPTSVVEYLESLSTQTYQLAHDLGGKIPYTVIREVAENFIHASFKDPVVSILDNGNTITFADQGPGIEDKENAQRPGFTSATAHMKQYIRGVGSGLPIVKEYLSVSGGHLKIEDNLKNGTIITITLTPEREPTTQQSYQHHIHSTGAPTRHPHHKTSTSPSSAQARISKREDDIMHLFITHDEIGQTEVKNLLGIPLGTVSRTFESLEAAGLITSNTSRKRILTEAGYSYLRDSLENPI